MSFTKRWISSCALVCALTGSGSATVIQVGIGGDFQAALNIANPGDTIVLKAGATFSTAGGFTLPNKGASTLPITIVSSELSQLPPAGYRVKPSDAVHMPKLVSTVNASPVLQTAVSAHHYKMQGIEIALNPGLWAYTMVIFGTGLETTVAELPYELTVDRCYIHADPTALPGTKRALQLNTGNVTVENSYISEIHVTGQDSQAIASFNGQGPFLIRNNYLEASTENVIFGGADPKIPNLVPSDIQILQNYFYKPLSWLPTDPSYGGIRWLVKNLFELKNAQRVYVEGNVFENNWSDGQVGFAIVLTPRSQDMTAPWSTVKDVTFTRNIVRHTASAVNMLSEDNLSPSQVLENVVVKDNIFEDINTNRFGGDGRLFQFVAQVHPAHSISIDHNTALHTGSGNSFISIGDTHIFADRLAFTNNICTYGTYGLHSPLGEGTAGLNAFLTSYVFSTNVIANGGTASRYPANNYFPNTVAGIGFVNAGSGDYHLAGSSAYRLAGSDGKDIGADVDAVLAATCGAVTGIPATACSTMTDTLPPVISGLQAIADSPFSATVSWATNEPADAQVFYGASTSYGSQTPIDVNRDTFHRVTVNGLSSRKTYHVQVHSVDASGNRSVSSDMSLTTPSRGLVRILNSSSMPVNGVAEISYEGEPAANFIWTFTPYAPSVEGRNLGSAAVPVATTRTVFQSTRFPIASLNLAPGRYALSVAASYADGDQSDAATADISLVSGAASPVRIRPNPWRANRHANGIYFDGVKPGSTIKLFAVSGRFVKTLTADSSGVAQWDLTNDAHARVASGLYLYVAADSEGQISRGTLTVIR